MLRDEAESEAATAAGEASRGNRMDGEEIATAKVAPRRDLVDVDWTGCESRRERTVAMMAEG